MNEATEDPRVETRHLEQRAEGIRRELDRLLGELERRRHQATDLRAQARRAQPVLAGLVATALVVGAVLLIRWRRSRRQTVIWRARRLGRALRRIVRNPDRLAPSEPRIGRKLAASAGAAATSVLARRLTKRALKAATHSRD